LAFAPREAIDVGRYFKNDPWTEVGGNLAALIPASEQAAKTNDPQTLAPKKSSGGCMGCTATEPSPDAGVAVAFLVGGIAVVVRRRRMWMAERT
jgi:MYXO-CTERM domain-containing protein